MSTTFHVSGPTASSLVRTLFGAGLLLAVSTPAYAYKYTGNVWKATDFPIGFYVSTYVEDSLPAEDPDYIVLASEEGFGQWGEIYDATSADPNSPINDAIVGADGPSPASPCAGLSATYLGRCDNTPYLFDYENRITFDDPAKALGSGVICATLTLPVKQEVVFNKLGQTFYRSLDGDIVCNDNIDFVRDTDILAGTCTGNQEDLRAVLTHEIGHFWGMGHSCDNGDPCTDQDKKEATMYWTAAACSDAQATLAADDITGISQLYGPSAETVCNHELDPTDPNTSAFGITPWTLSCKMQTDSAAEITSTAWFFGDGSTDAVTGMEAQHEYKTDGNFTLEVDVDGHNDACGDWKYQIRKPGYVLSCSVPAAEFTVAHEDGLKYKLVNNTSVHTYGCIYDIEWDVYDSNGDQLDSLKAWEPEFDFPAEGSYKVVLNVGGPAGTGAAELTFDVKNSRGTGYGCDSTGSGLGDLGLVAAAMLASASLRRKRA